MLHGWAVWSCDPSCTQVRLVASCHARRHWKQKTVPSVLKTPHRWTLKPVGNFLEGKWLGGGWFSHIFGIFTPNLLGKISTHFDEPIFKMGATQPPSRCFRCLLKVGDMKLSIFAGNLRLSMSSFFFLGAIWSRHRIPQNLLQQELKGIQQHERWTNLCFVFFFFSGWNITQF